MLSMHDEPQIAQSMLRAGATGAAIYARHARVIDPQIAENIALQCDCLIKRTHHSRLTERELKVLRLFALGTSVGWRSRGTGHQQQDRQQP